MELIYFLRELKQSKYDLNKSQMIVNRTKTDLDEAKRSLNARTNNNFSRDEDAINELRIEKARKQGYFDAAKLYFIKSAKQLGKGYGTILGIDLGTTNVRAGVFENGEVKIIDNEQGNLFTPSYVAFTSQGERLIGNAAKNQLTSNPQNTLFDVKRLIGHKFNDASVQQNIQQFPFKFIEENSKLMIEININKEQKLFAPEEISAMILGKIRETAEAYLGEKILHAIITVPAYFNDAQRQATIFAAKISGLNVIRIINEPTAAAVFVSGLYEIKDEENILIFHLGGGTFDVSLINYENDVVQVVATNGNTNLGGKDFDERVIEYFIQLFQNKTGKDIRQDNQAIQKLRCEVEKAKRTLSSQHQANVEIQSFFDNEDFNETLTRTKFEELNMDLFHLTIKLVEKTLKKFKESKISEVVLVGVSTRIPKIQQLIKEFFHGKVSLRDVYSDEAAVYGAALHGGFLSGAKGTRDIVLLDVNSFSISYDIVGERTRQIIPRHVLIPFKEYTIFTTNFKNQRIITFQVIENGNSITRNNRVLDKFDLTGVTRAEKGAPTIVITFFINIDGILKINAHEDEITYKNNLKLVPYTRSLSQDKIIYMIERFKQLSNKDQKIKERVDAKNELESYIYLLKTLLNYKEKLGEKISNDNKQIIESVIEKQMKWLESNQDAEVGELKAHKKQMEQILTPYIITLFKTT